ncbi:hypothetical protein VTN77DRAFT_7513 [Rasamsonia byssochlamydoides]|uniref:uncharacterized protein n=1 Tax=Rasamsonia byssochlamydoides TaxID=89139 RepID=UPI0037437EF4
MVSMVETGASNNNDISMDTVVPKTEPTQDGHGSMSSSVSTPEPEAETLTQDVAQTQKRKGGRKPIYATSEERKQRNRQAQAAFRERRTEYIKQLESTIKRNEETLQSLQQSHRSAADECLMLRYKNSLLERILIEKGIDVQAELRLKTGNASGFGPVKPGPLPPKQPSPLERAAISRNSAQRQGSGGIAPKTDLAGMPQQHRDGAYNVHSPQLQPTPSSHVSSPSTARSPGFALQGAMSPKGTEFQAQQQQQQQQQGRSAMLSQPRAFSQAPQMGMSHAESLDPSTTTATNAPSQSMVPGSSMASRVPSVYYPSPFQKHYDQLGKLTPPDSTPTSWSSVRPRLIRSCTEQEYDAQADMLDEPDNHGGGVESNSYVPDFNQPPVPTGQPRMSMAGQPSLHAQAGDVDHSVYGGTNSIFGQFEPMLDTDAFGLSASMHFQTPFTYEQNNLRH